MSGAAIFAFDIIVVFLLAFYLLCKYGNVKESYTVSAIVVVAWFFAFSIVVILPIDVSATFYQDCLRSWLCSDSGHMSAAAMCNGTIPIVSNADQLCNDDTNCQCSRPWSYVSSDLLPLFWNIVFWSSQLLTWILLPIMGSYISAGDFTVWQKLKTSLKENALVALSAGLLLFIFLVYITIVDHLNMSGLQQIIVAASNTWGLVLLVVMLGYGLVDVPQWLWRKSNRRLTMRMYQFRAAKLSSELIDAKDKLDIVYEEIREIAGRVEQGDRLRKYVNQILLKCPFDFQEETDTYKDFVVSDKPITRNSLSKLHAKVMLAQRVVHRCKAQWEHLMEKSFDLEDVIKCSENTHRRFVSTFGEPYSGVLKEYYPTFKWYWKCRIEPWVYLSFAVIGTFFSIALVWSEVTFSSENPPLSLYALLINWAGRDQQYFNIEVMTFFSLFYLCICAYRVIFKLRVFNFYYMVPHQHTDAGSLIFAAMFLSRLTPPLCLNFLSMTHLDSHVTHSNAVKEQTSFTQIMGHMDVVAFMKDFNTYYPMLILVLSFGTFFKLGSRLLGVFGVQRFIADDEASDEYVSEGKALINREKRRRQKKVSSSSLEAYDAAERLSSFSTGRSARASMSNINEDPDEGAKPAASSKSRRDRDRDRERRIKAAKDRRAASSGSGSSATAARSMFSLTRVSSLFGGGGASGADDVEELLPTYKPKKKSKKGKKKPPRNLFDDI